jgi:membrane associated rhomboid family serine protease
LLAAAALPNPVALEYDLEHVAAEPWRLLTSQLVHWSPAMLAADVLLAGIAGAIVERRSRALAVLAVVFGGAASAIAMGVSGLARYRGSSGIGTALLVAGGLELSARGVSRPVRVAGLVALAVGAAKIALERSGGSPFLPGGVVSATAVHVAGIAAGAAAFLVVGRRAR